MASRPDPHSEEFLRLLMRRQLRLSLACAATFLVLLLGLPLANYFFPEFMAQRVAMYDQPISTPDALAPVRYVASSQGPSPRATAAALALLPLGRSRSLRIPNAPANIFAGRTQQGERVWMY